MGLGHSPRIVTDGLVLALDAANPKNYNLTAVEVLVVAGGGGGGSHHGGGGGAGGLIYNSNFAVTPGSALTVTVGGGGAGGGNSVAGTSPNGGGNGGNSVFGSLTAIGGGGGGSYSNNGSSGGSGGGANNWSVSATGGSGTSGQGFSGASNNGQTNYGGGGGGAGGTAKGLSNNSGGDGLQFPQFASVGGSPAGWFAGGGAAGVYPGYTNDTSYGTGGLGGGGNGGNGPHESGSGKTSGVDNTGGGGGGSADLYQNGAAGGSGIVIVRYPGPQRAIGGTVTSVGGHTIHTFTTVGSTTFTPLAATNDSAILGLSDFSGNNNFGTTVNSPTYSSANGGSVSFDGTDEYVTLSSSQIAPGTGAFTWNFWAKSTRTQQDYSILFSGTGSNTDYGVIGLDKRVGNGLAYYANGFRIQDADLSFFGNWIYVSFIGNGGSNGSRTLKLFKNGVQAGSTYTYDYNFTSTTPYIGANHSGISEVMGGNIANVSYYNRALTESEIQQNYNALKSRFGLT
jgi:hypothetical protein